MGRLLTSVLSTSLMIGSPTQANIDPSHQSLEDLQAVFSYSNYSTDRVMYIINSICTQNGRVINDGVMQYNIDTNTVEPCDSQSERGTDFSPIPKISLKFGPCGTSLDGKDLCELRGKNFPNSCIIHDSVQRKFDFTPTSCIEVYEQIKKSARRGIDILR